MPRMPQLRSRIRVRGTVQGVGFRPTVYRLAVASGLNGFVRNDGEGVAIEIQGEAHSVDQFASALRTQAPPLSRIDGVEVEPLALAGDEQGGFRVLDSDGALDGHAGIPPDVATCDACLRELFDPSDRRYGYPFINCTDCGPRYTIVIRTPYDRERTTMAAFPLCAECRAEYEDPRSRRFHAEATACARCGPRLELVRGPLTTRNPARALSGALEVLAAGRILAVKGLGGVSLAADARNPEAVALLRARKHRPHKPFALMVRDLQEASRLALLDEPARAALLSPGRPIVLATARPGQELAPAIAPGLTELGLMLPYTPLHHLLLRGPMPALVMTSGNSADEPIARTNEEALATLGHIADAFLLHDREIHTRADDSVVRVVAGAPVAVRRARGFVPVPISLGFSAPPVLAVGAELKNTVCVTRDGAAFLSQHLGDLGGLRARDSFLEAITGLQQLLGVTPAVVAHDLHPDYASTWWAAHSGLRRVSVQHHHAHVASCLAEHGRTDRVIGVAFDGTGCGPAGDLWGGEFLLADLRDFARFAHLRPVELIGGEAAIREPWRIACAALCDAGESLELIAHVGLGRLSTARSLLGRPKVSPPATGAGRWFDAIAAMCGLRDEVSYEGQAAIELEALATRDAAAPYPFSLDRTAAGPLSIDLRPTVRAVAADLNAGVRVPAISARFHETLGQLILETCRRARAERRVETVALSGGCFQNRLLTERAQALLQSDGFEVLLHRRVPPNDGGVALGQAAIASFRLRAPGGPDVPRNPR